MSFYFYYYMYLLYNTYTYIKYIVKATIHVHRVTKAAPLPGWLCMAMDLTKVIFSLP